MESESERLERRAAKRARLLGEGCGINVAVGDLALWSASWKILAVDTRLPDLTLTVFDARRHVVPVTPAEERLCALLALHVLEVATAEIYHGAGVSCVLDFDRFREWRGFGDVRLHECPPEVVAWLS